MRAIFIAAGAVGAAAAVTAAVLVSAGDAPAASRPAELYLYVGDRDKTPVQLTGHPYSSVPAEIHTAAGVIMVGEGKLPPGYGLSGTGYKGWVWAAKSAQLTWANLNSEDTVIQNVLGDFDGVGNFVALTGGGDTVVCLSYQSGVAGSQATWLVLNPALDRVAAANPGVPTTANSAGRKGNSGYPGLPAAEVFWTWLVFRDGRGPSHVARRPPETDVMRAHPASA